MSGSNDALTQMLLMQARQTRRPSAQAQLAQQMMQQSQQGGPVWGAGPTIARALPGILGALMAQQADDTAQTREDEQQQKIQDRTEKRDYLQADEAQQFGRRYNLVPPAPAEDGSPAAPAGAPNWREAALAGFGSNNPAIQRQAQAALSIGQMEDQQAARQEQMRLQRELAAASRPARAPDPFETALRQAGIQPGSPEAQTLARQRLEGGSRQPAAPGGPFQGNAMEAQSMNTLLTADPASRQYAMAFNHLYGPLTTIAPDGTAVTNQRRPPQGVPMPAYAGDMPQQGAVQPQGAPPAPMAQPPTDPAAAPAMAPPAVPNAQGRVPTGATVSQETPGAVVSRTVVPGSPAAIAAETAARTRSNEERNTRQQADIVVSDVNRILRTMDTSRLPVTGFGAETLSRVAGSPAADVKATLDTLEAAAAFGSLTSMRQASPTGAALGAVSDTELRLLSATMGSLRNSQSPAQFRQNLTRFRDLFEQTVHGPNRGAAPGSATNPAPGPGASAPSGSGWTGRVMQ